MTNLYNKKSKITENQTIYDNFNNFILSDDRNIFNKLYSRIKFYEMTKHLMGDIVECGVFKGSGIATWLKILKMNEPNSIKKVIGFDFFDSDFVKDISDNVDKKLMSQVFDRCIDLTDMDISLTGIERKMINLGASIDDFELIKGDLSQTSKDYITTRPGFRISILYLDVDLGEPTYNALVNLWDRVVDGGIVVFDEYAYHKWSESDGVDKFINEYKLKLISTYIKAPTAYIIK
jgi:hypothetical protein